MKRSIIALTILLALSSLTGCQTPAAPPPSPELLAARVARNDAAADVMTAIRTQLDTGVPLTPDYVDRYCRWAELWSDAWEAASPRGHAPNTAQKERLGMVKILKFILDAHQRRWELPGNDIDPIAPIQHMTVSIHYADARIKVEGDPEGQLAGERLETMCQLVDFYGKQMEVGVEPSPAYIDRYCRASRSLMQAEIASSTTAAQRREIIERHQQRIVPLKRYIPVCTDNWLGILGDGAITLFARPYMLVAEQMLAIKADPAAEQEYRQFLTSKIDRLGDYCKSAPEDSEWELYPRWSLHMTNMHRSPVSRHEALVQHEKRIRAWLAKPISRPPAEEHWQTVATRPAMARYYLHDAEVKLLELARNTATDTE